MDQLQIVNKQNKLKLLKELLALGPLSKTDGTRKPCKKYCMFGI